MALAEIIENDEENPKKTDQWKFDLVMRFLAVDHANARDRLLEDPTYATRFEQAVFKKLQDENALFFDIDKTEEYETILADILKEKQRRRDHLKNEICDALSAVIPEKLAELENYPDAWGDIDNYFSKCLDENTDVNQAVTVLAEKVNEALAEAQRIRAHEDRIIDALYARIPQKMKELEHYPQAQKDIETYFSKCAKDRTAIPQAVIVLARKVEIALNGVYNDPEAGAKTLKEKWRDGAYYKTLTAGYSKLPSKDVLAGQIAKEKITLFHLFKGKDIDLGDRAVLNYYEVVTRNPFIKDRHIGRLAGLGEKKCNDFMRETYHLANDAALTVAQRQKKVLDLLDDMVLSNPTINVAKIALPAEPAQISNAVKIENTQKISAPVRVRRQREGKPSAWRAFRQVAGSVVKGVAVAAAAAFMMVSPLIMMNINDIADTVQRVPSSATIVSSAIPTP